MSTPKQRWTKWTIKLYVHGPSSCSCVFRGRSHWPGSRTRIHTHSFRYPLPPISDIGLRRHELCAYLRLESSRPLLLLLFWMHKDEIENSVNNLCRPNINIFGRISWFYSKLANSSNFITTRQDVHGRWADALLLVRMKDFRTSLFVADADKTLHRRRVRL